MKIIFKELTKTEYSFSIDGDEIGTVEKSIDKFGKNNWVAIDSMEGLAHGGHTKTDAVENLYYKLLAHKPDELGNAHSCKTHPNEMCIKCMYL
jgi:hypothetical protein